MPYVSRSPAITAHRHAQADSGIKEKPRPRASLGGAEKASVSALIHPAEERAQVSAAQAIPAPMNREQRRAAVKAHPAVVDFRAQEAAKAARRAQLKAELEALDNA